MNFLSTEKKKNEPLDPAPWPALNTLSLFFSIFREYSIFYGEMPANDMIFANFSVSKLSNLAFRLIF